MIEKKSSAVVLVFNDLNQLALQLRASGDKSFPNHWDFSAGGGIDPGEDAQTCAKRELREELGIEAEVEFVSQEHFQYPGWVTGATREEDSHIYKTRYNGPFNIDPKEVD